MCVKLSSKNSNPFSKLGYPSPSQLTHSRDSVHTLYLARQLGKRRLHGAARVGTSRCPARHANLRRARHSGDRVFVGGVDDLRRCRGHHARIQRGRHGGEEGACALTAIGPFHGDWIPPRERPRVDSSPSIQLALPAETVVVEDVDCGRGVGGLMEGRERGEREARVMRVSERVKREEGRGSEWAWAMMIGSKHNRFCYVRSQTY